MNWLLALCFLLMLVSCKKYDDENKAMFNAIQSEYTQRHKNTNDALAEHDRCTTSQCRGEALKRAEYWNDKEWESIRQMWQVIDNEHKHP